MEEFWPKETYISQETFFFFESYLNYFDFFLPIKFESLEKIIRLRKSEKYLGELGRFVRFTAALTI